MMSPHAVFELAETLVQSEIEATRDPGVTSLVHPVSTTALTSHKLPVAFRSAVDLM